MRAVVLLCLLHAAVGQNNRFSWNNNLDRTADSNVLDVCLLDQASCGCCLMQKQVERMEWFFNVSHEEMNSKLTEARTDLDNMRTSRSAFSVALNNNKSLSCFGPFTKERLIVYKHVFINLGDGYNVTTGVFTAPLSGVYSLALTVYSGSPGSSLAIGAHLQVNGETVATINELNGNDFEDSATAVVAVQLAAGDLVAVNMTKGCFICDNNSHFNTFTGFLLYSTEQGKCSHSDLDDTIDE